MPVMPAAAAPLAPVGIAAASPSVASAPAKTELKVSSENLNVLEGSRVSVAGALRSAGRPALSRRTIVLQALGVRGWRTVARARTNARGRFRFVYAPWQIGSRLIRVRFNGDAADLPSHRRVGTLNVYRLAGASWYGGGGTTACGQSLTSGTLGVANKTLPCGTMVTLRYGGHTVRVPVIDRGPYVEGREFDLTEATKSALGFGDTGSVWSTR